jgi:GTPase SAR1 family protein
MLSPAQPLTRPQLQISNWRQLKIRPNDRAILIGATGCGKTTLARYLIEDQWKPYSVVYDAKGMISWPNHLLYTSFDSLQEVGEEEKRILFRPDVYEALNPKSQDVFFQWVYEQRNIRLYVDEAYALLGGSNPSFHLQACLSRGRERGISTIIATQRPKRIPLITMSEAEHFYIFRLNLLEDRIRTEELTGIDTLEQTELREYEFYYYNALSGLRSNKLKLKI